MLAEAHFGSSVVVVRGLVVVVGKVVGLFVVVMVVGLVVVEVVVGLVVGLVEVEVIVGFVVSLVVGVVGVVVRVVGKINFSLYKQLNLLLDHLSLGLNKKNR